MVDTIFAFVGSTGQVYRTDDGGYSWLQAAVAPAGTVVSIAIAPNYATSGHMIIGNNAGIVYISKDRGATFTVLPGKPSAIDSNTNAYVAFAPGYVGSGRPMPDTHGIYAAGGDIIQRYYTPPSLPPL